VRDLNGGKVWVYKMESVGTKLAFNLCSEGGIKIWTRTYVSRKSNWCSLIVGRLLEIVVWHLDLVVGM
jgi:hypothetical protein